ncbi:GNAT family N-acetyltransferase [Anaerosporobacter faecicola]|uniref:GNAT family N-acetyltransferase n=1 Tax=Anaerosporobacter faecicola TaxID=2718714 RepID=UPI00143C843E|nr:GNAT family N-acetyltransferase [Anaerosporobacter faecicola]
MKNCEIRYARKEDYEMVSTIMRQVQQLHVDWRPDIYKPNDIVLSQNEYEEAIEAKTFVVAVCDGQVVGLLWYLLRHIENPNQVTRDILFVDSMAVEEEYRGQGIGRQLFDFIKQVAEKQHLDGIELQVNARNKQAKAMYESYGFTEKSINMELL